MGIQVEVSFRRREVSCFICRPGDIRKVLSRLAILGIAEIIVIRWLHPYGTAVRHWRVANVAWCASPKCIVAGMLWRHWACVCGLCTEDIIADGQSLGYSSSGRAWKSDGGTRSASSARNSQSSSGRDWKSDCGTRSARRTRNSHSLTW